MTKKGTCEMKQFSASKLLANTVKLLAILEKDQNRNTVYQADVGNTQVEE
jgi:hypothetical protein